MNSEKRKNHFINHLKNLQGKRYPTISKAELEKIELYCLTPTYEGMKKSLKFLGLGKYYSDIWFLLNKLFNVELIKIPYEITDKMIFMFATIQRAFKNKKNSKRINFISYNYVIYKLAVILNHPEICSKLHLLTPKNIQNHEKLWKKICKELKWKFIPL